ncbi:MAG: DEAD/DEAH box helicase, partial [Egibacteraceae bacterium]
MSDTKTFADFGVDPAICDALADADIHHPFPIQELTLPLGLMGADVIGQARTGTGKTLAFGIPLLQRVTDDKRTQALVIVPTRELCVQVRDDLDRASARLGTRVVPVYGGKAIETQAEALRAGAPVVVGTPGRLLDLLRRGILDLSGVNALVLDEADEMLDLGFLPDVVALLDACATDRQTQLFSATMPSAVVALARRYMRKPTFLRAEVEEARIAPETEQHFFSCHRMDKPAVLARILQTPGRGLCVVFTRTKRMADVLAAELQDRGIVAAPIHSDLRQEARERALSKFRKGTIDVLVATEVAARGLDISDVTHVVNYDCPDDEKMYLHRIGRTGRAGGSGVAITLAVWNELARLEMIKKALDVDSPIHEVFSTSPILDELFDLPARAPRSAPLVPSKPTRKRGEKSSSRGGKARGDATDAKRAKAGASGRPDTDRTAEAKPRDGAPKHTQPAAEHQD